MRNFKLAAALALGVSALGLSGCATGFPAQVSRYQAMPAPQGQSFVVVPMDARDIGGLEFSRYASMVAQGCRRRAMSPPPRSPARRWSSASAMASTRARTEYRPRSVRRLRRRLRRLRPLRLWRLLRPALLFALGLLWRALALLLRLGRSVLRLVGDDGIDSYTVYNSFLDLDIRRKADNASLFEGHAKARSQHRQPRHAGPEPGRGDVHRLPGPLGRDGQDHRRRRRSARAD